MKYLCPNQSIGLRIKIFIGSGSMENERYDNIEYESDWQTVQTVTAKPAKTSIYRGNDEMYIDHEEEESDGQKEQPKTKKERTPQSGTQLLIKFQLVICILAAVAAFALKAFGGELYEMVGGWYNSQINASLVITDVVNLF